MPPPPTDCVRRCVLRGGAAAFALLLAAPAIADANLFAAEHEKHVIEDPRTGLALFGYDAVAYHADHAARPGSPEHELRLDGRIWRFRSAANRAAFAQDPAAYMPLFGGHDAAGVGDGRLVDGDPAVFALVGGRVALFRDAASRDLFARDADLRLQALRAWPDVLRRHAGH